LEASLVYKVEFQDSQGYTEKPCLEKTKNKNQPNKQTKNQEQKATHASLLAFCFLCSSIVQNTELRKCCCPWWTVSSLHQSTIKAMLHPQTCPHAIFT
jgi:hypothetical protein